MIDTYSVPLTQLVKQFNLEVIYASKDYESIRLTVEDLARPGLPLAGFFDHYDPMRLQVMGNVEMSYVSTLTEEARTKIFDRLFSYRFPALLIARGIWPGELLLSMARKHDVTILGTEERDYYIEMESEAQWGDDAIYAKSYKCKYDRETKELISRELEAKSNYMR